MNYRVRLIVCEQTGLWAMRIRAAVSRELTVRETRHLADCRAELAAAPASLVVVELRAGHVDDVMTLLAEAGSAYPLARVVIVAPRGCETCEDELREAGAVYFTTSPRASGSIARLAECHAAQVPKPRVSFAERIWESLPWPEAAAS